MGGEWDGRAGSSTFTIKESSEITQEIEKGESYFAVIGDDQLDHSVFLSCQDKSLDLEPQGRMILSLPKEDKDKDNKYFQSLNSSSFCFLPNDFGLGDQDSVVLSLISRNSWDVVQIVGWPSEYAGADKGVGASWGIQEPVESYFGPLTSSSPGAFNNYPAGAPAFPANVNLKISEVGFVR